MKKSFLAFGAAALLALSSCGMPAANPFSNGGGQSSAASTPASGGASTSFDENATYPRLKLTDEQYAELMDRIDKTYDGEFIEYQFKGYQGIDLRMLFEQTGFTYEEAQSIFDLIAMLNASNAYYWGCVDNYFSEFEARLRKVLAFFDPAKLVGAGVEEVLVPACVKRFLDYDWGVSGNVDQFAKELERAEGEQKQKMLALDEAIHQGLNNTVKMSRGSVILAGRFLRGIVENALKLDRDLFFDATLPLMARPRDNIDYKRMFDANQRMMSEKYISYLGKVVLSLGFSAEDYARLFFDFGSDFIDWIRIAGHARPSVVDTRFYGRVREVLDEARDLISGADIKNLVEFAAELARDLPADVFFRLGLNFGANEAVSKYYDSAYAKLGEDKKASLKRISEVLGVNFETMVTTLKKLPEAIYSGESGSLLSELFQPTIDKYNADGRLNYGRYEIRYSPLYFIQGESVGEGELRTAATNETSDYEIRSLGSSDLPTGEVGFHTWTTEAKVTDRARNLSYETTLEFNYYVLPEILAEQGPVFQNYYMIIQSGGGLLGESYDSYKAGYATYDESTHGIKTERASLGMEDLLSISTDPSLGRHQIDLDGVPFTYFVTDGSDLKAIPDYFHYSDTGSALLNGTVIVFDGEGGEGQLNYCPAIQMDGHDYPAQVATATVTVPAGLRPGQTGSIALEGFGSVPVYRPLDSECKAMPSTFDVTGPYNRSSANAAYAEPLVVRKGASAEESLKVDVRTRFVFEKDGRRANFSEYKSGVDFEIAGFSTDLADEKAKTATITVGGETVKLAYVVAGLSEIKIRAYNPSWLPIPAGYDLSKAYFRIFKGYAYEFDGLLGIVQAGSVDSNTLPDLSRLDNITPGLHREKVTLTTGEQAEVIYTIVG
ncbi:MAG: hypothetical protein K6F32_07925 [Bacilli bacterium]|nr:hypothetical protein [Bacilli bacterium]